MRIIGIDPGLQGAFATFCDGSMSVVDMPKFKMKKASGKGTRTHYDEDAIVALLSESLIDMVVIEEQHPFPGEGVVSIGSMMYAYGFMCGVIKSLGLPHMRVHPKKWQKEFSVAGKDSKALSLVIAKRLYPSVVFTGKMGGPKDGRADACLICEYGRRIMNTK